MLDQCLAERAGGVVGLADAVEGLHFTGLVAGLAEQGDGLLVVLGGLLVVALPVVDVAEVSQCVGFAGPVADLTEQGQGALVVLGGMVVAALPL